jgi:hypothetical protein
MLYLGIAERRNWARVLLLLLSAYSALWTAANVIVEFERLPVVISLDVVATAAIIYALFLLFSPATNRWFREKVIRGDSSADV